MKQQLIYLLWVCLLFVPGSSSAFNIDKMTIISDDRGNGVITVSNERANPIFVEAKIQELKIIEGNEVTRNDYTRENLSDWKISITHPRMVLKPGEQQVVGIRSLCFESSCDSNRDLMFMLPFIPSNYVFGKKKDNGVHINYGLTTLYIIPASEPVIDYNIINNGPEIIVENSGNTMIYVTVDACANGVAEQCQKKYMVLAGRVKNFPLPQALQSDSLKVTISSHNNAYSKVKFFNVKS